MTAENFYIKPAFESERTVLGGLLLNNDKFETIKNILCPNDFINELNQEIFKAMSILYEKRHCFDIAMLIDYMEPPVNEQYMFEIANNCCSTNNLIAHADIIREKSVQRQLIALSKEIENNE